MKPGAWLMNSCRGAVVDNAALRRVIEAGRLGATILDVWEGEPEPNSELVRLTDVATPHIAGYSFDGKVLGTTMVYEAFVEQFGLPHAWDSESVLNGAGEDKFDLSPPSENAGEAQWLHALTRQMYDIAADDARMRALLELPREDRGGYFIKLRKNYPRRRTFNRFQLPAQAVPDHYNEAVRGGLRVQLV
jgi:erythronate-4-phosphate dehydrogenase